MYATNHPNHINLNIHMHFFVGIHSALFHILSHCDQKPQSGSLLISPKQTSAHYGRKSGRKSICGTSHFH